MRKRGVVLFLAILVIMAVVHSITIVPLILGGVLTRFDAIVIVLLPLASAIELVLGGFLILAIDMMLAKEDMTE